MAPNRTNRKDWIVLHMDKIRPMIPEHITTVSELEDFIVSALEWYEKHQQLKREELEER